jgi:hypothetical protein
VSSAYGVSHGVCYCRDCRAYAHALGKAAEVLDAQGGTEVVGVAPRSIEFTHGADALACLSLRDNGTLRWYASCCGSPICNTPRDFRMSYAGVLHTCLRAAARGIDDSFGPVRIKANLKGATGPTDRMLASSIAGVAAFALRLARDRLGGAYKITPFFDARTGAPVATPRVLGAADLDRALRAAERRAPAGGAR